MINKNKFDYFSYKQIIYDDLWEKVVINYNVSYYNIPRNESIKSFDSALLYSSENKIYNLILFQITNHKKTTLIKDLFNFTQKAYTVKEKFQKIYEIIKNIYFYYILGKELDNDDTKCELMKKKINFIYFSMKNGCFYDSNNNEMELFSESESAKLQYEEKKIRELNFEEKYKRIIRVERDFIQRKRERETANHLIYELIRRKLLKENNSLFLNEKEEERIFNCLKKKLFL